MKTRYRKHTRLKNYNYSRPGYYFVTICSNYQQNLFYPVVSARYGHKLDSNVVAGLVPANEKSFQKAKRLSEVVETSLDDIVHRFRGLENDFYIIMPDHLHWIVGLGLSEGSHKGCNYTLSDVAGVFKSLSTRASWKHGVEGKLWQPNYYDHVIRNELALQKIREYILKNPYVEYDEINWKKLDN